MFLKDTKTGDLVEVTDLPGLFDPCEASVSGRFHAGEEMQEEDGFPRAELVFPSGEGLPRCWTDANYRS